ncbi:glycosyltransferase family 2 protein [Brevibacterium senegalense]|uniref:glycosyltransferase family 2 protein n=1 Tax=Brevibacterium senegalense TaxID=1033736 RepID=UPI0013756CF2|nr:glycosyltransferase family 2 protein [Brevibacterium senegalense]
MRTDRPQLSVIIPCHQASRVLPLQLNALRHQVEAPAFEVIIVDNRSTDDLKAVVDTHRPGLVKSGATAVRIVDAPLEAGVSYARNVGARHAKAGLLVFCDADDCVSSRWLADAMLLFTRADAFSGSAIPVCESEFSHDVRTLHQMIDPSPGRDEPSVRLQESLAIPILMGGNFGMTRELFHELGGFDQSLPFTGEDNDLAFRLRASGRPVLDSHAMRIAYRTRDAGPEQRQVARRAASVHVLLCERYGVRKKSAYLQRGQLVRSTLALPLAAIRMLSDSSTRDFPGLASRAASVAGFWQGIVQYCILRRLPIPRQRVGLTAPTADNV